MDNRRQHARFPFSEPLGYQKMEGSTPIGSLATDISQGGFKIHVNEFLPMGSVLELKIQLPGQARVIPAYAKVVWVKEMPYQEDAWEIGLELTANDASSAIRDYIGVRWFEPN